jgi:hypothetical protein
MQAEADRAEKLYKAGIIDRAEAKRIAGLEAVPEDEGILHPSAISTQAGTGASLAETTNAAGILIRSGYDPGSVTNFLNLPVQHTGAAPVTLRDEAAKSLDELHSCTPGVVYKSHPFYGYELMEAHTNE